MQVEYFGVSDGPRNLEVDLGAKNLVLEKFHRELILLYFRGRSLRKYGYGDLIKSVLN